MGALWLACALALLVPAAINSMPLLFADSAVHLRTATGNFYAIERSYFYGLAHRPFLAGAAGPDLAWRWALVQAGVMAALVAMTLRRLEWKPDLRTTCLLGLALLVSSAPWHVSQLLPDAYTPALALLAFILWRSKTLGAATLAGWLVLLLVILFHHGHLPLFLGIVVALAVTRWWARRELRSKLGFFILAGIVSLSAFFVQRTVNQAMYGEQRYNAVGPLFLAAALEDDKAISRWLDAHCPHAQTQHLCAMTSAWPANAQDMLWGQSPLREAVFAGSRAERHLVLAELDVVNAQVMREPSTWISGLRGALVQLTTFAPLDDDCPECAATDSSLRKVLRIADPQIDRKFGTTPQARDAFPKEGLYLLVTLSLIVSLGWLLFRVPALIRDYGRGDPMLELVAASMALVLGNAFVMGIFSRPDDRYQSRVYWVLVLVAAIDALRRSPKGRSL